MGLKPQPARIIPEREAWLYENEEAREAVRRGLAQARAGRFSQSPPDLKADRELVEDLEDMEQS